MTTPTCDTTLPPVPAGLFGPALPERRCGSSDTLSHIVGTDDLICMPCRLRLYESDSEPVVHMLSYCLLAGCETVEVE